MNLSLARSKSSDGGLTVGLPQVNLLPPEVRAARAFGSVRRLLVFAIIASAVIAVGIAALGITRVGTAQRALADEEARTQQLLAQQAQYSEVPRVLKALNDAKEAREYGMASDVLWVSYLQAITAVMPEDVSIDRLTIEMDAPLLPLPESESPLVEPSVARITFGTRSATVPDTSLWLDALESLPGFRDAFFRSHTITQFEDSIFYEVESTIELDAGIYSGRFLPEEAGEESPSSPEASTDDEKDS